MQPHSQGHMYLAWERGYSECPIYGLWENERQLIYNFSLMWTSCSYRSLFWSSKQKSLATVQEACLIPCLVTITGIMQRAVLSLKCRSFGCLCWKLEVSEPHCTICGRALLITELCLCLDSLRMSGWGSHQRKEVFRTKERSEVFECLELKVHEPHTISVITDSFEALVWGQGFSFLK